MNDSSIKNLFEVLLSVFVLIVAIVVGVQIVSDVLPISKGTAIGLIFCALGFIVYSLDVSRSVRLLFSLLITILAGSVFLSKGFLSIDQISMGSALCFFLVGLYLLTQEIESLIWRQRLETVVSGLLLAFSSVAIVGCLFELGSTQKNTLIFNVQPATAVVFFLFAGLSAIRCFRDAEDRFRKVNFFLLPIGVVSVFTLHYSLVLQENQNLRKRVEQAAFERAATIENAVSSRILALKRMVRRWEEAQGTSKDLWTEDARNYAVDLGFVAVEWVDRNYVVRWVEPIHGNERVVNLNLAQWRTRKETLDQTREQRRTVVTRTVDLVQGGRGFRIYVPIFTKSGFDGFMIGVLNLDQFFNSVLEYEEPGIPYGVRLLDNRDLVYTQAFSNLKYEKSLGVEQEFRFLPRSWSIRVWPSPRVVRDSRSFMKWILPGLVLVIVFFMGMALRSIRKTFLANQLLSHSNEFLDSVIENIPAMLFLKDAKELKFIRFNRAGEKLLGVSREELYGKSDFDFFPKEQAEFFIKKDQDVLKGSDVLDIPEEPIDTKEGQRYLHTRKIPVRDSRGEPLYLLGISEDITAQKAHVEEVARQRRIALSLMSDSVKNEERAKLSEARIASILDTAPDAIITIDRKGQILDANSVSTRLFGYEKEELVGCNINKLMPESIGSEHDSYLKTYEVTGIKKIIGMERSVEGKKKDGTIFPIRLNVGESVTPAGKVFTGIITDITLQKEQERALKAKAEELARSNSDLEQFAYVASHDLQTPLRHVASYTQLLEKKLSAHLDEEGKEWMGYVTNGVSRMRGLIDDLLTFSRTGRGAGSSSEKVNLNSLLEEIIQTFEVEIESTQAEIQVSSLPEIFGGQTPLRQLFQNLIGNALKFRKKDVSPKIRISCEKKSDFWEFVVKDNGIGFEVGQASRIFNMFQRLHKKSQYEGTGIGLSVAKKVVELHGGQIWVESKPGEGAAFYFTLRA